MRQHQLPESRGADTLSTDPQTLLGVATGDNQLLQCIDGETVAHGSAFVVRFRPRTARDHCCEAGDVPKWCKCRRVNTAGTAALCQMVAGDECLAVSCGRH